MLREISRGGQEVTYLGLRERGQEITMAEAADTYAARREWVSSDAPAKGSLGYVCHAGTNALFSRRPFVLDRYISRRWRARIEELGAEADVVVCDFLTPAPNFEGLRLAAPVVLFQHNMESQIWKRLARSAPDPARRLYFQSQYRRMWAEERRLSAMFSGVITVSPEDSEFCRTEYGLANVLGDVPTGVDVSAFQPPDATRDSAGAPVIGFLGSMDWMPNIDGVRWFTREVLPGVRREVPGARFKIVGRNPPSSIRELAQADRGIEVTGTVAEVQPHVHECAVIVVPLLSGGGTRIKIFECMAMGVPVISTTIGAEGLPVRAGETIAIADDASAFASEVSRLLRDREGARAQARRAREQVEARHSWKAAAEEFTRLCGKALGKRA